MEKSRPPPPSVVNETPAYQGKTEDRLLHQTPETCVNSTLQAFLTPTALLSVRVSSQCFLFQGSSLMLPDQRFPLLRFPFPQGIFFLDFLSQRFISHGFISQSFLSQGFFSNVNETPAHQGKTEDSLLHQTPETCVNSTLQAFLIPTALLVVRVSSQCFLFQGFLPFPTVSSLRVSLQCLLINGFLSQGFPPIGNLLPGFPQGSTFMLPLQRFHLPRFPLLLRTFSLCFLSSSVSDSSPKALSLRVSSPRIFF